MTDVPDDKSRESGWLKRSLHDAVARANISLHLGSQSTTLLLAAYNLGYQQALKDHKIGEEVKS